MNSTINIKFGNDLFLWQHLKSRFLKNQISKQNMQHVNLLRKLIIDGLINHCIKRSNLNATPISVGTADLTSDYDLTLNGPDKEQVVIEFNELFESMFGMSSADIFDSNLYGSAPYEIVSTTSTSCENKFNCSKVCLKTKKDECVLLSRLRIPENAHIVINQHVWALTALIRQCDEEQIDILRAHIKSPELQLHFEGAVKLFNKHSLTGKTIRDLNSKYGQQLKNVKRLREIKQQTEDADFEHTYANAVSLASYYSQESYVSAGPFLHVVGLTQSDYDIKLSNNEWLDSFIENSAGVVHLMHSTDSCLTKVANASKYFMRLTEALLSLISDDEKVVLLHEKAKEIRKNKELIISNNDIGIIERFLAIIGLKCDKDEHAFLKWFVKKMDIVYDQSTEKCLQDKY